MFRGPAIDDQSDGSPWARSVEARLQKIRQGLLQIADFGSELFASAVELGTSSSAGTARSLARSDHVHRAPGFTYFRGGNLNNGTSTSYSTFRTDNTVGSLPVAYKMVVSGYAIVGGNASANKVYLRVMDEAGNAITWRSAGAYGLDDSTISSLPNFNTHHTVHFLGTKDYAANAVCGWRLAYKVDTSNVYIDAGVRIDLIPQALTHSA